MRPRGHRNRPNYALVVRRANFCDSAIVDPLPIKEEAFGNCGSGDDAGHVFIASSHSMLPPAAGVASKLHHSLSAASKAVSVGSAIIFFCLLKFLPHKRARSSTGRATDS